jgi:hypothetical protein
VVSFEEMTSPALFSWPLAPRSYPNVIRIADRIELRVPQLQFYVASNRIALLAEIGESVV